MNNREATAALLALLATPMGRALLQKGAGGLARLLGISKQTLSAAMTGTDPLSYRVARTLARLLGLSMDERVAFLRAHVRAMARPMLEVSDLEDRVLMLVVETIERYRERQDERARGKKGART